MGKRRLPGRGRRAACGGEEVRSQVGGEGRANLACRAGDDGEADGRRGRRRAARHRLCRCLQPAGGGPLGVRGQARGHLRRHRADQGSLRAQHRGGGLARQRQDRQAGLLRLSPQAADPAHPVLEGHPGRGRLQGERHPLCVEGVLGLLVRQGAAGVSRVGRRRRVRRRQPDGHRIRRTPTSRSWPGSMPTTSGWSTTPERSWWATPRCGKG